MALQLDKSCKTMSKITLHIEIIQEYLSTCHLSELEPEVEKFLQQKKFVTTETNYEKSELPLSLSQDIYQLKLCELGTTQERKCFSLQDVCPIYYMYKLENDGPAIEDIGAEDGKDSPAATHWVLPSADFHNLWDTLIYDSDIKEQLLNFVSTTLLFSDKGVDSNLIAWNRVLLLHGPPGTGKTSLCKALAQKLSIRFASRYDCGQLFEINSHSLFSKWFSESGKLVQKLFDKITELVEDPQSLVCVLIDEVESLTRARASTASGSEPSDALRVVNALLTQLDQIKRYPNVLILTTSNITGTIDLAFVDRADIKQFIGLPSPLAIYQIYQSCIVELMKKSIIYPKEQIFTVRQLQITNMEENEVSKCSLLLWRIAEESQGLSGRALRKIPFLAHALHIDRAASQDLKTFLDAMRSAVEKHKQDASQITQS